MPLLAPGGRLPLLIALALAAPSLPGCDLFDQVRDEFEDATEPVRYSGVILLETPLPEDEDGSGPDLYVEIQNPAGGAAYRAPSVLEDATPASLPYVLDGGGELAGTTRAYALVVFDRDADGYDRVAFSESFTPDSLRASPTDTFTVVNRAGTLRAQLLLDR